MYFFEACDIEGCEHRIIPKLYFLFQLLHAHAQHVPFQFHFLSVQKVYCVFKSVYCLILNSHRLLLMLITISQSMMLSPAARLPLSPSPVLEASWAASAVFSASSLAWVAGSRRAFRDF